ncbi:polysaccharide lyase 8 family protein [Fodinicola acaciae]|uniref:polysaccharide lyase 8 family protein n=1 Tax=Fodinicola acaciae TaxID=2681555 RepID=UPI0013D8D2EB|nr:polysaccharide lyase 8 family protein [Fodinicola acaciae]
MQLSRRQVFGLAAGMTAAGLTAASPAAGADVYDTLRKRAVELIVGGPFEASDADYRQALDAMDVELGGFWQALDRAPARTSLWPDLPLTATDAVNANLSLNRLRQLAIGWSTTGAELHANADVASAVVDGLAFVYQHRYNESAREVGNWWNWEIGGPRALAQTCLILFDQVPAAALANYLNVITKFVPNPDRRTNAPTVVETGANRMDKCLIIALSGILGRDGDRLAQARDGLSDTRDGGKNSIFQYVESGDGIYRDGSFVQHGNIPYVGTYGNVLLGDMAYLSALLAGSPWEITDPHQNVVLDAVTASFAPFITNGRMMDCVRGRAISRDYESDHKDGHAVVASMLMLAAGAPAAYSSTFRALAKGWILRDTADPYLRWATVPQIGLAKQILADQAVAAAPEPSYHRQFAYQDRIVHRRPSWSFSLGLSSARTARYEAGNAENLHGWYLGDGVTYFYDRDLGQFSDGFWPTVDAYRLPGITVQTTPRTRADEGGWVQPVGSNTWVGGTTDGDLGAVGMDLRSYDKALVAKKSWFCLDDAVIALGAGITRTGATPTSVESIVDNRNLHSGSNQLLLDGRAVDRGRFPHAHWAHLHGIGGYAFGSGAAINVLRESRTGAWFDIDQGADTSGSKDPLTRNYLTLWFDHGIDPVDAAYSYAVLPGASIAETMRWSAVLPMSIAANSPVVQAIRRPGLSMANFWTAGSVDRLVSSGPASVLLRRNGAKLTLAVADPSRTQESVTLHLPCPVRRIESGDQSVTLVRARPFAELRIATGGSNGRTHKVVLS